MDGIRTRMHDGDLRFERLEMRLSLCEKTLAERSSDRSDVKQKLVSGGIDLLKLAVIGIASAAIWAFANGYGYYSCISEQAIQHSSSRRGSVCCTPNELKPGQG